MRGSGLTQLVSWQTHYGSLSRTAIVRRWLCHYPLFLYPPSVSSALPLNKCIPTRLTCNTRWGAHFPDFQGALQRLGAWHAPLSLGLVYKTCYRRRRMRKIIFSLPSRLNTRENIEIFKKNYTFKTIN